MCCWSYIKKACGYTEVYDKIHDVPTKETTESIYSYDECNDGPHVDQTPPPLPPRRHPHSSKPPSSVREGDTYEAIDREGYDEAWPPEILDSLQKEEQKT